MDSCWCMAKSIQYCKVKKIIIIDNKILKKEKNFQEMDSNVQHHRKLLLKIIFLLLFSGSVIWLFSTPWTAAHQASLSFTVSHSLLEHMSIESRMPSNYLILCHPPLLLKIILKIIFWFSSVGYNYWMRAPSMPGIVLRSGDIRRLSLLLRSLQSSGGHSQCYDRNKNKENSQVNWDSEVWVFKCTKLTTKT